MPRSTLSKISYYICLLLLGLQLVSYIVAEKSHGLTLEQLPFLGDFNHYYATAVMTSQGNSPYCVPLNNLSLPNQIRWHASLPQATNPPLLALATAPLAWISIGSAWLIWEMLLALSLFFTLVLVARERQWSTMESAAILLLLLISSPSVQNFRFGQVQPILLLLTVLGWRALRNRKEPQCGIFWGIAIALKFYLWPLGLACVLLAKRKAAAVTAATFAIASVLAAIVLPRNIYEDFAACAKPLIEKSALIFPMNFSAGGIIQHLRFALHFPMVKGISWPFVAWFYWLPLGGAVIALVFFCRRYRSNPAIIDYATGIAAMLGILSAPVAWPHYYLFAFLLALLCYSKSHPTTTVLFLLAVVAFPYQIALPTGAMQTYERLWFAIRPLPTIVLIVWATLLRVYSSRPVLSAT